MRSSAGKWVGTPGDPRTCDRWGLLGRGADYDTPAGRAAVCRARVWRVRGFAPQTTRACFSLC